MPDRLPKKKLLAVPRLGCAQNGEEQGISVGRYRASAILWWGALPTQRGDMGHSPFEIARIILDFMGDEPAGNFRVGTARAPRSRLPGHHLERSGRECLVAAQALSAECAKDIAHFFVTHVGMHGCSDDEEGESSDWVCVYRKGSLAPE